MKTCLHFIILLSLSIVTLPIMSNAQSLPDNIDISTSPNGIVPLPNTVPSAYISDGFVKYTKIDCPNGEAIHFVAQNTLTDAQIVKARTLLEFYLKDVPGSQYGTSKLGVTNNMGLYSATLLLLNGSDNGTNEPNVDGQPLYAEEIAVEGHQWYTTNDYNHRDASFEEILHLMHLWGIGVNGTSIIPNPALPVYSIEIVVAQDSADNNFQRWPLGAVSDPSWYNELTLEGSLSAEYLASVIDSYYGLWAPWTGSPDLGMWGEYIAKTRAEVQLEDPMGWALVPKFFAPFINVDMIIDQTFNGIFSMTLNPSNPYTHKSQYLQHCYLDGTNNSGLQGNDEYNRLKGNSGNNSFEGLKGNDRLDGQGGSNTAIFTGNFSDYTVNNLTTYAIVSDGISNRDGVDTLWNMHFLQFADQTVPISLQTSLGIVQNSTNDIQATVYPNPTKESISIELSQTLNSFELEIREITGQLLHYKKYTNTSSTLIDVSEYSPGIYFVKLLSIEGSKSIKFLKQ